MVRPIFVTEAVDCKTFRDFAYHYQANELAESDRERLQAHLDACAACARYLEVEESFARVLRARLARARPPEDLHDRIRRLVDKEPSRRLLSSGPTFAIASLAAAATLVVVLLAPTIGGRLASRGSGPTGVVVPVIRAATIVDEDCDRAHRSLDEQRSCRSAGHLNCLKLADGSYWSLSLEQGLAREIVVDALQRGRRVVVEGEYYPDIRTVHVTRLRDLRADDRL